MRYGLVAAISSVMVAAISAQANCAERDLPSFLPSYYSKALDILGKDLVVTDHEGKDGVQRYIFSSPDQVVSLKVESIACERERCQSIYANAAKYFDDTVTANSGEFRRADPNEFVAQWQTGLADNTTYVARLPSSVLLLSYGTRLERRVDMNLFFSEFNAALDRHRYEQALDTDVVQKGLWSSAAYEYARSLLKRGDKANALDVLKSVIVWSPFDYGAHLDFAENTSDATGARNSGTVVYENAEDQQFIARAERILRRSAFALPSVTELGKQGKAPEVVFIPLPPCDLRLVVDAASLFNKMTDIFVRIERPPAQWSIDRSSRIPDQRRIQQTLIQKLGPNTNFSGWSQDQYKRELLKSVEQSSALTKFTMKDFVAKLDARPPQYDAVPLYRRLADIVAKYPSGQSQVIYVGVTAADIFLGDTNYVFSASGKVNASGVSLLSYSRMLAAATGERYQSRKRLTERLAKQLVPATLSHLGIPRPADPTDPYSYADSVERVDQKSMTLSGPTKEALDKLR